jgi:hypothetical protein
MMLILFIVVNLYTISYISYMLFSLSFSFMYYQMKHYGWTAAEVIGWMRVCRPGMVIGPQQHWMERQQEVQWRAGAAMRQRQQKNEKKGTGSGERKTSNSPARDSKQSSSMNSPHTRVNSKGESQGDFLRSRRSPKNERR